MCIFLGSTMDGRTSTKARKYRQTLLPSSILSLIFGNLSILEARCASDTCQQWFQVRIVFARLRLRTRLEAKWAVTHVNLATVTDLFVDRFLRLDQVSPPLSCFTGLRRLVCAESFETKVLSDLPLPDLKLLDIDLVDFEDCNVNRFCCFIATLGELRELILRTTCPPELIPVIDALPKLGKIQLSLKVHGGYPGFSRVFERITLVESLPADSGLLQARVLDISHYHYHDGQNYYTIPRVVEELIVGIHVWFDPLTVFQACSLKSLVFRCSRAERDTRKRLEACLLTQTESLENLEILSAHIHHCGPNWIRPEILPRLRSLTIRGRDHRFSLTCTADVLMKLRHLKTLEKLTFVNSSLTVKARDYLRKFVSHFQVVIVN